MQSYRFYHQILSLKRWVNQGPRPNNELLEQPGIEPRFLDSHLPMQSFSHCGMLPPKYKITMATKATKFSPGQKIPERGHHPRLSESRDAGTRLLRKGIYQILRQGSFPSDTSVLLQTKRPQGPQGQGKHMMHFIFSPYDWAQPRRELWHLYQSIKACDNRNVTVAATSAAVKNVHENHKPHHPLPLPRPPAASPAKRWEIPPMTQAALSSNLGSIPRPPPLTCTPTLSEHSQGYDSLSGHSGKSSGAQASTQPAIPLTQPHCLSLNCLRVTLSLFDCGSLLISSFNKNSCRLQSP